MAATKTVIQSSGLAKQDKGVEMERTAQIYRSFLQKQRLTKKDTIGS